MELQGCSVINDIWIYYLRENKLDNLFRALSVLLLKKKKKKNLSKTKDVQSFAFARFYQSQHD